MATAALALGTTAAGLYYVKGKWESRDMPPGPTGVPIFGNALQMDKFQPQLTLTDWGKEFGDVSTCIATRAEARKTWTWAPWSQ